MTELVNKLVTDAGLTPDQAIKSVEVIKQFVIDKFPMLSGAVDNVFKDANAPAGAEAHADKPGFLDKISDYIPGEIGEKVEGFAKKAAGMASEGMNKAKKIVDDLEKKV